MWPNALICDNAQIRSGGFYHPLQKNLSLIFECIFLKMYLFIQEISTCEQKN